MADVTGSYTTPSVVISQNTEAVLRHKARFINAATGTPYVALPLKTGLRYIIYSAITAGSYIKIGLSTNGSTILDAAHTYFEFTRADAVATGPLDLSQFFSTTPFTQYFPPTDAHVYLLVLSDAEMTISVVDFKI
jgi:hypothetical protein